MGDMAGAGWHAEALGPHHQERDSGLTPYTSPKRSNYVLVTGADPETGSGVTERSRSHLMLAFQKQEEASLHLV